MSGKPRDPSAPPRYGPEPLVWEGLRVGAGHAWPIEKIRGSGYGSRWLWQCECGNTFKAAPYELVNQATVSCGCVGRARSRAQLQADNATGAPSRARWEQYRRLRQSPLGRLFIRPNIPAVPRGKSRIVTQFHD